MEINIKHVKKAYLYLKGLAYHENLNLFLKQKIAKFETLNMKADTLSGDNESNNGLDDVFTNIVSTISNGEGFANEQFEEWLQDISYHLLPKSVEREEDYRQREHNENQGLFISNVRESENYSASKVNYFINAPVEIHIIEILWCLFVGSILETKMSKDSYGNRMHPIALQSATSEDHTSGTGLFKRYIYQYNKWRDRAIEVATKISKSNDDVALLSFDIKSFYYSINLDFEEITKIIEGYYKKDFSKRRLALQLNTLLTKVHISYQFAIKDSFNNTHSEYKDNLILPIGLYSSSIIANWYLSEFDDLVESKVRPDYYGRYVDDIIMVFKRPIISNFENNNSPIESFIKYYLIRGCIEFKLAGARYKYKQE